MLVGKLKDPPKSVPPKMTMDCWTLWPHWVILPWMHVTRPAVETFGSTPDAT